MKLAILKSERIIKKEISSISSQTTTHKITQYTIYSKNFVCFYYNWIAMYRWQNGIITKYIIYNNGAKISEWNEIKEIITRAF